MINKLKFGLAFFKPEFLVLILPFTFFFPIGIFYFCFFIFCFSLVIENNLSFRYKVLRENPVFFPILLAGGISFVWAFLNLNNNVQSNEFWSALAHYQTWLLIFPLLTLQSGSWQISMERNFFAAALIAALIYFYGYFFPLPDAGFFTSYATYSGGRSISQGILLAVAACWVLLRYIENIKRKKLLLLYVILVVAVLFLTKTRTAILILIVGTIVSILFASRWNWKVMFLLGVIFAGSLSAIYIASIQQRPATCIVNSVKLKPWEVLQLRFVCTVQQINDIRAGRKQSDDDGMRSEIYQITTEIISEKPIFGHGVGSWRSIYPQKAKGLSSAGMAHPHNDYLLYITELGFFGLITLLIVWGQQIKTALKLCGNNNSLIRYRGNQLIVTVISMMIGACFNAIMRDAVYATAFISLLSVSLAGLKR